MQRTDRTAPARSEQDRTAEHPMSTPVAVLFVDVSGSMLLYAVRGDAAAFELTSACLDRVEEQVVEFQGTPLKRIGDAVLAKFDTAVQAVQAAAATQRELQERGSPVDEDGLHVRMGIASGTVVVTDGDVYGDVVNVAARLVDLARADEIVLSRDAWEALPNEMQSDSRLIDHVTLRGRPDPVGVYEYVWGERDSTVTPIVRQIVMRRVTAVEVLYAERTFSLDPDHPRLAIGRGTDNDITIQDKSVSRHHAELVVHGDKLMVIDHSTNGTAVHTDRGDSFRLVREELALAGSGAITAGRASDQPVRYRVLLA